jgi:hypothetical protein
MKSFFLPVKSTRGYKLNVITEKMAKGLWEGYKEQAGSMIAAASFTLLKR